MKKLEELEKSLKEYQELLKSSLGDMITAGIQGSGSTPQGGINSALGKEDEKEDEKKDKKLIEEKLDEHNEKKHGEAKDEDSAFKAEDSNFGLTASNGSLKPKSTGKQPPKGSMHGEVKEIKMKKGEDNLVKFHPNGQWSLEKKSMDKAPEGKYKASHKEVMDGDDGKVEVGGKSVDGDKGKTVENKKRG